MRLRAMAVGAFLCLAASSAQAQAGNAWRVNGAISGRTFVLDCRLEASGLCTDASKGGKSHKLESLTAAVDRMHWSFKTQVVMMSITLAFDGKVQGDRMIGTMTAAGRNGTFTAIRR